MSELTQCNWCSLQRYKAQAKHDKMEVTLMAARPVKGGIPNGIDVYIHPRALPIRQMPAGARRKYWVSWFMELSDHCVC